MAENSIFSHLFQVVMAWYDFEVWTLVPLDSDDGGRLSVADSE